MIIVMSKICLLSILSILLSAGATEEAKGIKDKLGSKIEREKLKDIVRFKFCPDNTCELFDFKKNEVSSLKDASCSTFKSRKKLKCILKRFEKENLVVLKFSRFDEGQQSIVIYKFADNPAIKAVQ